MAFGQLRLGAVRFAVLTTFLVGCTGVKFNSVEMNNSLPEELKNRSLFRDESGLMRYRLTELVGSVLFSTQTPGVYDLRKVILADNYRPKLETVKEEEGKLYTATVDSGAAAEGSYFSFAAKLSAEQIAGVTIQDMALVFVLNNDVPWRKLVSEAHTSNPDPSAKRYWVQGALLTLQSISNFTKISADANGVVGPTMGAKGNVYNKQGLEFRDYKISLRLVDLDKLAQEVLAGRSIETLQALTQDSDVLSPSTEAPVTIRLLNSP